jgi:hypothetical protein
MTNIQTKGSLYATLAFPQAIPGRHGPYLTDKGNLVIGHTCTYLHQVQVWRV